MKNFIKKIPMLVITILLTLFGTATISYACSYASCGCSTHTSGYGGNAFVLRTCKDTACWYAFDFSAKCSGHAWTADSINYYNSTSTSSSNTAES